MIWGGWWVRGLDGQQYNEQCETSIQIKQQNYMSKLIRQAPLSLPISPVHKAHAWSPSTRVTSPKPTPFYSAHRQQTDYEDTAQQDTEVSSFCGERVCGSCESGTAVVLCGGCQGVEYCGGCWDRVHRKGKFQLHAKKKIVINLNPETNKFPQITISLPKQPQCGTKQQPRNRNCSFYKENKIDPHQMRLLLTSQLSSFNIKVQILKNNANSYEKSIVAKWANFEEKIKQEIENMREIFQDSIKAVMEKVVRLIKQELKGVQSVNNMLKDMEKAVADLKQDQEGLKNFKTGQLWQRIKIFNKKMANFQEIRGQRSIQYPNLNHIINSISKQIKKSLNKLALLDFTDESKAKDSNVVLSDSKITQQIDLSLIEIKKPKNNKVKDQTLGRKARKSNATPQNQSLDCSFLTVCNDGDRKTKMKKVKSETTIAIQPARNMNFMKTNKRKKVGEGFTHLLK